MIPLEALKSPEGAGYMGGAVATFIAAALLAVNTYQKLSHQSDAATAWLAFHQGDDAQARTFLGNLRDDRPEDPLPRLLLGAYEADRSAGDPTRLEAARRLFDEAWKLEASGSAAIGGAVVRLRLANTKPADQRQPLLTEADELIRQLGNDPDAAPLKAGLALLRGKPEEARKLLDGAPPEGISLDGLGAWHWNRAAAMCLTRDGRAFDAALLAFQLRPFPGPEEVKEVAVAKPEEGQPPPPPSPELDAQRLLVLSARVALADPAAAGKPEELAARCTRARAAMSLKFSRGKIGGRGRFLPIDPFDEAAELNAVGLGSVRAQQLPQASAAFEAAQKLADKEPLYALNLAEARRLEAEAIPVAKEKERRDLFKRAADAFHKGFDLLNGKKGREEAATNAAWNLCVALIDAGDPRPAAQFYMNAGARLPIDDIQRARDLGALFDQAHNGGDMIKNYEKAIAKGHADADLMSRRIRNYQSSLGSNGKGRR